MLNILVSFVAIQHIGFLILEMFLWQKPIGLKVFRMSSDQAKATTRLAMNQGLYNGFLAAGLILVPGARIFFLSCVVVAGVFGGITVNKRIMIIQALPAAIALMLQLMHA